MEISPIDRIELSKSLRSLEEASEFSEHAHRFFQVFIDDENIKDYYQVLCRQADLLTETTITELFMQHVTTSSPYYLFLLIGKSLPDACLDFLKPIIDGAINSLTLTMVYPSDKVLLTIGICSDNHNNNVCANPIVKWETSFFM